MSLRYRKGKNGSFSMDLGSITELRYRLQFCRDNIIERLARISNEWGSGTETSYASKIKYANGFTSVKAHANKTTFHDVDTTDNGLKVAVGHRSFLAKFLEVGTKAHYIPHKTRNGKMTTAKVSGLAGSKALSKAMDTNRKNLASEIEQEILSMVKG